MTNLVVVAVDVAESITINGGKLGGLINIEALTAKLNELVRVFNSHTHTLLQMDRRHHPQQQRINCKEKTMKTKK